VRELTFCSTHPYATTHTIIEGSFGIRQRKRKMAAKDDKNVHDGADDTTVDDLDHLN